MAPDTVIAPALVIPNVNPPVLVIALLIVNVLVPAVTSVFILDAEATVIAPVKVAAEEAPTNFIAPPLLNPVPLMVNVSGILNALVP